MCANKAAISISENRVQYDRNKHVELDRHFIKEKLMEGVIESVHKVQRSYIADILTKTVTGRIFDLTLFNLGIGDPTTQLEEC